MPHKENPGVGTGASSSLYGYCSHQFHTATSRQAQILASRFSLSPWLARDIARLCFGERSDG